MRVPHGGVRVRVLTCVATRMRRAHESQGDVIVVVLAVNTSLASVSVPALPIAPPGATVSLSVG